MRFRAIALAALMAAAMPTIEARAAEPPAAAALAEVRPEERVAVAEVAAHVPAYIIDATVDAGQGTIIGTLAVTFENRTGAPLDDLWFRLFPNMTYYGEGGIVVDGVTADGAVVDTVLTLEETALGITLPTALAPGASTSISMAFTTTVPLGSLGSYGIFRRSTLTDTWTVADWYPILAVHEAGGWNLSPPNGVGDPTFAEASLYDVRLTVPAGTQIVASGVEVEVEEAEGIATHRFIAGPARDFTMVLSSGLVTTTLEADGVRVAVLADPAIPASVELETAAEIALRALAVFEERFGPYPYSELELVQTELNGALAVSWAGVIFVDTDALARWADGQDAASFETLIAHEVAHLWWGAVVGSDSNVHPFLNEGLATLSSMLYQQDEQSPDVVAQQLERWVGTPIQTLIWRGDQIVDLPATSGDAMNSRYEAVYGKSTTGFLALREAIGAAAFDAVLGEFAMAHRFGVFTPEDLRDAFAAAPGADPQLVETLWQRWFSETALTEAEADAALAAFLAE